MDTLILAFVLVVCYNTEKEENKLGKIIYAFGAAVFLIISIISDLIKLFL